MDLNIKDKDGNDIRVVLPEDESSQESNKEYEIHPEALEEKETSCQKSNDEETEDKKRESVLSKTVEERISKNSYVDSESRIALKSKAYNFNKTQLRKNFSAMIAIIGILLEIYKLGIAHSSNKTYTLIIPICIIVAIITFITYTIKYKKLSKTIVSDYNNIYKNLCLKWSKFGLTKYLEGKNDNIYSNADKTIFIETVENTGEVPYTKISFTKDILSYKFDNLILSDGEKNYEYIIEPNNGDTSEISILDYIYGKGFDSFYNEYNYSKITERIIKENSIIDAIAEFVKN